MPAACAATPPSNPCPSDRIDATSKVIEVIDGDTLRLADFSKLRLIGINTPEIGNPKDPHPETFAIAARDRLQALINSSGQQVQLRYDQQRYDRYDRLLAHAFLMDGRSINAVLLEEGLAAAVVVPPNDWQYICNQPIEAAARSANRGIWSLPRYQGLSVEQLRAVSDGGFYAAIGRISDVKDTARNIELIVDTHLHLSIQRRDAPLFTQLPLQQALGKRIRVIGWMSKRGSRYNLRLLHPSQLQFLE